MKIMTWKSDSRSIRLTKILQKKKETIYYILKTTYNVSHSTTTNIARCVIQLLLD